jgi:hypothetical protein
VQRKSAFSDLWSLSILTSYSGDKRYDRLLKAQGVEKNKPTIKANDANAYEASADAADGTGNDGAKAPAIPKLKTPRAKKANGDAAKSPATKKRKVDETEKEAIGAQVDGSTSIFGNDETVEEEV